MSHTIEKEGFTPAILAFGAQPRVPLGKYEQHPQYSLNSIDLMTTARRECEPIVSSLCVKQAVKTSPSNEEVANISPGDEIFVYREEKGWDGLYTFLYHSSRLSVVSDGKGVEHLFHNIMRNQYTRPYLAIRDLLNPSEDSTSQNQQLSSLNLVETVCEGDDERFVDSRQKEYDVSLAKEGAKVVNRAGLLIDANFVGNRLLLCIKDPGTPHECFKA